MEFLKKNLKILIPLFIVIISLITFLILFFNIPRIKYEFNDTINGMEVTNVYGNSNEYEIEDKVDGYNVVSIGVRSFYHKTNLVKIKFKDSSKIKISKLAFSECDNLEIINLDNILEIETSAFSYCKKLDNITISAKNIGASAFYGCDNLKNIELKDGIKNISSYAFSKTKIEELSIPQTVENIYTDAFIDMPYLKKINCYSKNLNVKKYLDTLKDIYKDIEINYL